MARDNRKKNKKRFTDNYKPEGDPSALAMPVEELGLSEKTVEILKNGGIATASDLAARRMSQMYKIRYVGKRECLEVGSALKKIGLSYREEEQKTEDAQPRRDDRQPQKEKKAQSADDNARRNGAKNDRVQNNAQQQNRQKQQGQQNQLRQQQPQPKQPQKQEKNNGRPKYDYKQYEGMSLYEIVFGKRERPVPEKPQKEQLTPDSIVKFCRKGKWGYKDWKGNVLIQPVYDDAYSFHEGMACVEKDGKLGFINTKNELVIDYAYDSATSFSEGLAAVSVEDKSGYIDKEGNAVTKMEYDVATAFENGKAIVRAEDRWGVLDRETMTVLWR